MRQVVLDTETTGLDPRQGHRIIEIGCIEMDNRRLTGRRFHRYINPDREIDNGAIEVHGITNEFLADKPRFGEVAKEFIEFIDGAELVIHNAAFDVGFIDHELSLLGPDWGSTLTYSSVLDTLLLARKMHPGQRNSLDALCKRYEIDNSQRDLHGALLDAGILAEVYLAMTGGQTALLLGGESDTDDGASDHAIRRLPASRPPLPVLEPSEQEMASHLGRLAKIDKASGGQCLWLKSGG
jgi:DNA polymerase-3 subunit epsilon